MKRETVANCYAKAGFRDPSRIEPTTEEILAPPPNMSAEEFNALIRQDENLEVCGPLSDAEIVQDIKRRKTETAGEE